jgi:hypothetical protein
MAGGRLSVGFCQLLSRFLKTPLIARRVRNIGRSAASEQGLAGNDDDGRRRYGCQK